MKRKLVVMLVALFGLSMLVGCGSSDDGTTDTAAETTATTTEEVTEETDSGEIQSVNIATVANMLQLPEFVGVERGFFIKHGLDVNLMLLSSGADISKALQSGDAEIGSISTSSAVGAWNAGLKSVIAVPEMGDATTPYYAAPLGIVGNADSGIVEGDPSSLRGKKIAVHEGSTNDLYLAVYLAENGMSMDDIERVPLTTTDHTVSLSRGDVDAATSWEPTVSQNIRALGDKAVIVSRGEPFLGYMTGVGGTQAMIDEHRDAYLKYGAGIAEATQFIRQNPEEAAQDALAFIEGLELEDAEAALDGHVGFDPRLSFCVAEQIRVTGELMVEAGTVEKVPDTSKMVDPTIMAEVEEQYPEFFSDLPPLPDDCQF